MLDNIFSKSEYIIKNKSSGSSTTSCNIQLNLKLIKQLEILKDLNEKLESPYKVKAYSNAIYNMKKLNVPLNISNVIYLKKNKMVGDKIYKKIIEFLQTGKIQEVNDILLFYSKLSELLKIKGIGMQQAKKFMDMGIDSIESIKKYPQLLNRTQLLGIKYYSDFNTKIPYNEVTSLFDMLKNYTSLKLTIAGSYRRKKDYSSDMDIIVTLEDILNKYNNIETFKKHMSSDIHYIETLSSGNKKYSILIKSPISNLIRQVDFIIVLKKEYYSALLYFTGSKQFNTRIREILKKKGYSLNEYYLLNNKNKQKYYLKSEKELFDFLKINYITPENR